MMKEGKKGVKWTEQLAFGGGGDFKFGRCGSESSEAGRPSRLGVGIAKYAGPISRIVVFYS
jgi:hypothetical protein